MNLKQLKDKIYKPNDDDNDVVNVEQKLQS